MPNLDKTGPMGDGPTGLGRGECITPRARTGWGRGLGQRLGFGRKAMTLKDEEKMLEKRLQALRARMETK